jgi:phospholipid/cholesterol/gamma-HCH transport system substrate-binding protein
MNRGGTAKLGFFFFVALVIVLYGTLILGDIKFLSKPLPIQIHFESVTGLRRGDDVRVDGLLFGKVTKIDLDPKGGVRVGAELNEPIELFKDARIYVQSSTVLGGTSIMIHRGSERPAMDLSQPLAGIVRPGLEQIPDSVRKVEPALTEAIQEIKTLVKGINEGKGTIGQLVTSPRLHDELAATVQEARQAIGDARGTIAEARGALVKIREVGETVQKAAEKLEKGEGPLPALLNDGKMTEKLNKTLETVQETANNLKVATEKINKGEGTLGKLLNDPAMGEQLKNTVQSLEKSAKSVENITERIEKGPGTINKLIQDPELYNRAKEAVEDLDKVLGKAARAVVEIVGDWKVYSDSEATISKLGMKIRLSNARDFNSEMLEDKYFYLGAAFMMFDREGTVQTQDFVEEDDDTTTIIKADVQLAYRIPWFLDRRIAIHIGLLEGKVGGGVDVLWEDWGVVKWPIQFSVEIRDAYNSVEDEDIDEGISGPMIRAFAKAPIWTDKEGWLGHILSTIRIFGGFSGIGDAPEYVVGVGLEWSDDDVRSVVSLLGLAR